MTEIREQGDENVRDFIDGIIDQFGEASGQPFGWSQFAFDAVDSGERIGAIVGFRLYDWLYVEYIFALKKQKIGAFPFYSVHLVRKNANRQVLKIYHCKLAFKFDFVEWLVGRGSELKGSTF